MITPATVIQEAVRELRKAYGLAQQAFSARLDMSIASIANYETGARVPDGAAMAKLARAALEITRPDLARIFEDENRDAMGGIMMPIRNEDEHRKLRALQYVLFDPRFEHLREPLAELLAPVEAHLRRIEKKLRENSKALFAAFDAADELAKKDKQR